MRQFWQKNLLLLQSIKRMPTMKLWFCNYWSKPIPPKEKYQQQQVDILPVTGMAFPGEENLFS